MIYTIGYQGLAPAALLRIVEHLDAVLIDCRHRPVSRIPGYGGNQLNLLLNAGRMLGRQPMRYEQHGHHLGGRGNVKPDGITELCLRFKPIPGFTKGPHCILMCMEEAPWECHRHHDIVKPHFPDALHIYAGLLYSPADIDQAIATRQMPPSRGELFPSE